MFCTCISGPDFNACCEQLADVDFAEFRLDLIKANKTQRIDLYKYPKKFIATFRHENGGERACLQILEEAIINGATYIDIDVRSSDIIFIKIQELKKHFDLKTIISYHNFERTPSYSELIAICKLCSDKGSDLIKVVSFINSPADNALIMSLYKDFDNLLAFGMGNLGRISRLASLYFGAPFIYVAPSKQSATADGQFTAAELFEIQKLINFNAVL